MFFITTINGNSEDTRCVGYYSTFEKAEKAVLDNACDIWENYYDYCVIENIKEGLYQYDENATWYKWNKRLKAYEKTIQIPIHYEKVVGLAIG